MTRFKRNGPTVLIIGALLSIGLLMHFGSIRSSQVSHDGRKPEPEKYLFVWSGDQSRTLAQNLT